MPKLGDLGNGGKDKIETFRQGEQVGIDFKELRKSGELNDSQMNILEKDYPGAPRVYLGESPLGVGIGIKTGETVHSKNIFNISHRLAKRAIKKLDS